MNNRKLEFLLKLDRSVIPSDGGELYNRLIFAKSPYLLQHAENPVDWREWGDDAFMEAVKRDLPLFISIGYATCHWCHVMADESFSDPEVAAILNKSYIPVKIDREERPDLDEFYMTAARSLTGSGGWPLNVFIDHDRRPFFSITYLPKLPKHKTPRFIDLLTNISALWKDRRETVFSNATEICHYLATLSNHQPSLGKSIESLSNKALTDLKEMFDERYGGFGNSVKFPMPTYLIFILSRDNRLYPDAGSMAVKTLDAMMSGGINDQIGGGFHRYTVDRKWLIPHFEKMLYDQAMLIIAYSDSFLITGEERYLETALKTAEFTANELLPPEGGFCAALDADSCGEEGIFYTWTYEELAEILGDDCSPALDYWCATRNGDLDGRRILHSVVDPDKFSLEKEVSREALTNMLDTASKRLVEERNKRERPLCDTKVISGWNALMITALLKLYAVSNQNRWLLMAEKSTRFMLSEMVNIEGRLVRNWLKTRSTVLAFAEDYANLCLALAELSIQSTDPIWKENLATYANELLRLFITESGEVLFCGTDGENMPEKIPVVQDGVMPSTVGSCALAFIKTGKVLCNRDFMETGRKIIQRYRGVTERNPAACLSLIMAEEELQREK